MHLFMKAYLGIWWLVILYYFTFYNQTSCYIPHSYTQYHRILRGVGRKFKKELHSSDNTNMYKVRKHMIIFRAPGLVGVPSAGTCSTYQATLPLLHYEASHSSPFHWPDIHTSLSKWYSLVPLIW